MQKTTKMYMHFHKFLNKNSLLFALYRHCTKHRVLHCHFTKNHILTCIFDRKTLYFANIGVLSAYLLHIGLYRPAPPYAAISQVAFLHILQIFANKYTFFKFWFWEKTYRKMRIFSR